MEQNLKSLVSVPNIPGINPRSLHNAFNVKAYIWLKAICPSDGDIKPSGPLGAF